MHLKIMKIHIQIKADSKTGHVWAGEAINETLNIKMTPP
jgi:hypothetical protein